MIFEPADPRLFFTRNDPRDPRLGELSCALRGLASTEQLSQPLKEALAAGDASLRHYVIAGYPDDEGIQINGGRVGAAAAPDSVRRPLYKMTPPLFGRNGSEFRLWDAGNLVTRGPSLAARHDSVSAFARAALDTGARWIGIGGGHDYGFPDAKAYIQWCRASGVRPLVLNFDAHLDVRPVSGGLSSGTPFYRMLELDADIDFAEIGIQTQCNSRAHMEWVQERGGRILTQEEIEASGEPMSTAVSRLLGDWLLRPRPAFISIDIDGFSSSVAPGCSQSWATGFMPSEFFPCLQVLSSRLDVRMLGIYEVSPPLDQDDRTAKLAAQIVHRVIS